MSPLSLPQLDHTLNTNFIRTLSSTLEGELRLDLHNRMLYATDASLYQVEPLGVIIPADIADGVRAVQTCSQHNIAMLPRGGGTSLAGQCTNRAVVIDWSNRCRAYRNLNVTAKTIDVEPGITIDDLNDAIASSNLFFAPDPATARHASIGGCIGNNAAGARSIMYGRTSENIAAIDACLADATRVRLEHGAGRNNATALHLAQGVCNIVRAHAQLIRDRFPKTVRRNAGYGLDMVLKQLDAGTTDADIDLSPLLCGSEGTLAITLGATLKLHDKPKVKALAVLGFSDLDEAIAAVVPILTTKPSAVELLDDLIIELAKANTEYRKYVELMPAPAHGKPLKAVLYVEYFAASNEELESRLQSLRTVAASLSTLPSQSESIPLHVHRYASAMLNAWKLRKAGEPLLHGVPGNRKPITFIEDNAIPVERLSEFVRRLRAIVTAHNTIASYWAHASVGVLHVRPLIDIHDPADRENMISIATQTADLARELGGVMSGEHGDGRVRSPFLERYYGPELIEAFKQVKRLFDPHNLLNPGNIVDISGTNPRPISCIAQSLRVEPQPMRPVAWPTNINQHTFFDYTDQHGFDGAVEMCNGSGVCRKQQGGTMCPSYHATLDERHSTRGRGNALRLAITGQLNRVPRLSEPDESPTTPDSTSPSIWNDPATKETLHLCLSCKACKTECPSNVDIARLKAEYTAQQYRETGTPLAAKIMGEIRTLNRLGAIAPAIANWMNQTGLARTIMNRVLDIHPQRSLPKFSEPLDRGWKRESHDDRPARRAGVPTIALFADCFTMYNESHIGLATKRIYEAFGYNIILTNPGCCGRAKISLGLLAEAIHDIDATLERLTPLIESDDIAAIIVAEPSCLSAFKDDWLNLKLRTPLSLRKKLAAKSFLPEQFLHLKWDTHPTTPRFNAPQYSVLLHAHCHQKALWGANTSADILRRIAGDNLRVLDTGCCGMAGSFGYTTDRYDLSMKIGDLKLLPEARQASHDTAIAAPGTSCRHQIHDGAAKHAKHPIELLADWLAR